MRQTTQRVYPALGHMKLDKITARHIQAFISDLYVKEAVDIDETDDEAEEETMSLSI